MLALIDKSNSTEGECLYHIANALNGCALVLIAIFFVLVVYVHHIW